MHLVGYFYKTYHDARSPEHKAHRVLFGSSLGLSRIELQDLTLQTPTPDLPHEP